jgi:hypothetical protein
MMTTYSLPVPNHVPVPKQASTTKGPRPPHPPPNLRQTMPPFRPRRGRGHSMRHSTSRSPFGTRIVVYNNAYSIVALLYVVHSCGAVSIQYTLMQYVTKELPTYLLRVFSFSMVLQMTRQRCYMQNNAISEAHVSTHFNNAGFTL